MYLSREAPRRLFDSTREYVIANGSRIPEYDGSLLRGVRPVSEKLMLSSEDDDNIEWSLDHKTVTITHSLDCIPIVTVIDDSNVLVMPTIRIVSASQFVLDFYISVAIQPSHPWTVIINYGADYIDGAYAPVMPRQITGPVEWGDITGTITEQTDLRNILNSKGLAPILRTSPPTSSTAGELGQFCVNTVASTIYYCKTISIDDSDPQNPTMSYTWQQIAGGGSGGGGGGGISDVQVNGTSVVSAGVASISVASNSDIDTKSNNYKPIVPQNLNYAVRSVMSNVTTIPAATSEYNLLDASATTNNHSYCYYHSPSQSSVYTLPDVTDSTVTHSILLDVDFTSTQSIAFVDTDDQIIIPQKSIVIAAGDRWRFACIYSFGMWLIYPLKLNVAVIAASNITIDGDTSTALNTQLAAVSSDGGVVTYTASGLPAGVSCSNAGLITGTPEATGTTVATITAKSDYAQSVQFTVTFEIA